MNHGVGAAAAALLIAFAAIAFVPPRTADLVSQSTPATGYADAMRRIARQQAVDARVVAPGGATILMTHGARSPRVVVLFHGFTNSPQQFVFLAARLFGDGDNVYVPRLPHHAERHGTIATLANLTAEELTACADSAIDAARGLGDSVIVMGVSAGGTITAWVAQTRSDVRRAVIVAPVLGIGRIPSFVATPLMNLALRFPNVNRSEAADPTRPDRTPGASTRAVAQLLRLGYDTRRLASARQPGTRQIVFVVNANDRTVKTAPALALAREWSTGRDSVVVYQFPRSLHLPHDIAEVAHPNADTALVYPALEALIHGVGPPAALATHRLWPTRTP